MKTGLLAPQRTIMCESVGSAGAGSASLLVVASSASILAHEDAR